jgi:hypothetical protein
VHQKQGVNRCPISKTNKAVSNKVAASGTTSNANSRTRSPARVVNRAAAVNTVVNRVVNNPTARFQILLLWPRQRGFFSATDEISVALWRLSTLRMANSGHIFFAACKRVLGMACDLAANTIRLSRRLKRRLQSPNQTHATTLNRVTQVQPHQRAARNRRKIGRPDQTAPAPQLPSRSAMAKAAWLVRSRCLDPRFVLPEDFFEFVFERSRRNSKQAKPRQAFGGRGVDLHKLNLIAGQWCPRQYLGNSGQTHRV